MFISFARNNVSNRVCVFAVFISPFLLGAPCVTYVDALSETVTALSNLCPTLSKLAVLQHGVTPGEEG